MRNSIMKRLKLRRVCKGQTIEDGCGTESSYLRGIANRSQHALQLRTLNGIILQSPEDLWRVRTTEMAVSHLLVCVIWACPKLAA